MLNRFFEGPRASCSRLACRLFGRAGGLEYGESGIGRGHQRLGGCRGRIHELDG